MRSWPLTAYGGVLASCVPSCGNQGAYSSFGVSGGHLNPALTLAFAMLRRVRWRDVPAYLAGQFMGSFLAAVLSFVIYTDGTPNGAGV